MFRKPTELEREPKIISERDVSEDLQVGEEDPLYSGIRGPPNPDLRGECPDVAESCCCIARLHTRCNKSLYVRQKNRHRTIAINDSKSYRPHGEIMSHYAVKKIITAHETADIDEKSESLNSKSFRTIEKILQMKEDMVCQKRLLVEKFDDLHALNAELEQMQNCISISVKKVYNKSDI